MYIAHSLEELRSFFPKEVRFSVTIGNFDGVHVGHKKLILEAKEQAAAYNTPSIVVTFDPHPVHVIRGIDEPGILTPLPRKLELLEKNGADATLVLSFTKRMAEMPAKEFVKEFLVDGLRAKDVIIGFDFAFGKGRAGGYDALRSFGECWDFIVMQVPPVIVEDEIVSSSVIREHVRCGDVARARPLLGRLHSVDGMVVRGEGRGRTLGFPTANIDYGKTLLPSLGAYATWFQSKRTGAMYPSMTSVGTNPTFAGKFLTLETHVLDFSGDLYDEDIRIFFVSRLRGQVRFRSVEDLVTRLHSDALAAKSALDEAPRAEDVR